MSKKTGAAIAKLLLPRAVGYSVALLDYFFRGDIELSLPDNGVYAIAPPPTTTPPDTSFKEIRIKARNATKSGEQMSSGTVQLVVKYKVAQNDPFLSVPVDKSDFQYLVIPEKNHVVSIPSDTPVELVFDLSSTPIPFWATDVYLQVVYRGELGNEADAVAVGFKDISEPTPVDIINNMDHVCVNGVYLLAGGAEAVGVADANGNGQNDLAEWDIFSHGIKGYKLAFAPATRYSAEFAELPPAGYGRVFVLTDYDTQISGSGHMTNTDQADSHLPGTLVSNHSFAGVKNQTDATTEVLSDAAGDRTVTLLTSYFPIMQVERGIYAWTGVHYENFSYPADSVCTSSDAQPNLTGPAAVVFP